MTLEAQTGLPTESDVTQEQFDAAFNALHSLPFKIAEARRYLALLEKEHSDAQRIIHKALGL